MAIHRITAIDLGETNFIRDISDGEFSECSSDEEREILADPEEPKSQWLSGNFPTESFFDPEPTIPFVDVGNAVTGDIPVRILPTHGTGSVGGIQPSRFI